MTKERLMNELENYKTLYKNEKERREKLEKERESLENYQTINLDLQVKIKEQEERIKSLETYNQILTDRNKTYETTFDILKGVVKSEYR